MGHGDDLRGGGAPGASVSEKTGKPGRADELDVWRVHSWWGNSFHFKAFFKEFDNEPSSFPYEMEMVSAFPPTPRIIFHPLQMVSS